jgi:hypothetical protein
MLVLRLWVVFGLLVGVEALKTVGLEELSEKFSRRISKLPVEFQSILFEDLETAIDRRLKVLEKFGLKSR